MPDEGVCTMYVRCARVKWKRNVLIAVCTTVRSHIRNETTNFNWVFSLEWKCCTSLMEIVNGSVSCNSFWFSFYFSEFRETAYLHSPANLKRFPCSVIINLIKISESFVRWFGLECVGWALRTGVCVRLHHIICLSALTRWHFIWKCEIESVNSEANGIQSPELAIVIQLLLNTRARWSLVGRELSTQELMKLNGIITKGTGKKRINCSGNGFVPQVLICFDNGAEMLLRIVYFCFSSISALESISQCVALRLLSYLFVCTTIANAIWLESKTFFYFIHLFQEKGLVFFFWNSLLPGGSIEIWYVFAMPFSHLSGY